MTPARRRLFAALKLAVALALIAAVGWHFAKLLRSPELAEHQFRLRLPYLLLAGLLYLATHTLWGTFWVQLMNCESRLDGPGHGGRVGWLTGVRAYFISQFGKYVPGKAWVILLRVALLRHYGPTAAVVGVTATYETLTSMAAGALLGVILLPWAGLGFDLLSVKGFALLGLGLLPLTLAALTVLAKKVGRKRAERLPHPPFLLLTQGLFQASVGWALLGLSLWCVVAGLSAEVPELTADDFLKMTAAVTLSYVIGFVVLVSPGGLGAREAVLLSILGGPVAAVVALVLRLVWTSFEILAAGTLYFLAPGRRVSPSPVPSHPDPLPIP